MISILLAAICLAAPGNPAKPALRHSDVVFFIDEPSQYDAYGCTVIGWGGYAEAEHVRKAHDKGVRLLASDAAFRTAFHSVIDYSPEHFLDAACRNFTGEPFPVPWLWDHKYKDQPVWWGCTNSPLYREWLDTILVKKMATGVDGLHIDDYTGTAGSVTWLDACFCEHCMAAFREWLKTHTAPEKLKDLGITDINTFNYRQFLIDRGITPETYHNQRFKQPLSEEFLNFHVFANNDYVCQFHKRACELRGQPVTLSVNSSLDFPQALVIAPYVDYFCCEVGQGADKETWPTHPVYIYKLAAGLNRPVAAMASGQDHAYIAANDTKELLRTWIVTAYTHGQAFTAPTNLWCYTQEKGTHWYKGRPEDYAWLFQFVRTHASLFDDYEVTAPTAIVYDNAARRKNNTDIAPICEKLEQANIPFNVIIAGDDWLDYRLTPETLTPYQHIITAAEPTSMDPAQHDLLTNCGRLVTFSEDLLPKLPAITIEAGKPIAAVLRAIPGNPSAPLVLHLHNREYDRANDCVPVQHDITVAIPRTLIPDRPYPEATIYTPSPTPIDPQRITPEPTQDALRLTIPQVGLWSVITL